MTDDSYRKLAEALDRLPNGFPGTPSGVEISILKKIFSPEEALIVSRMCGNWETVDIIAERIGLIPEEAGRRLAEMAGRGLLLFYEKDGKPYFRLAPFIVGIYEAHMRRMDHEFAHLMEKYMAEGGAAGIMKPHPALHRVLPAQNTVKSEWILPYDDVKAILENSKSFTLQDCICRIEQAFMGRKCKFETRTCLSFSQKERPPAQDDISKEEALKFLFEAEEMGLVHTVSNVAEGVGYVCNCCGCCCGILRGITEWGIENSVAHSNYHAVIDHDVCLGCWTCEGRCQVNAISQKDGMAMVQEDRCIGCGLCVTGCPNGAAELMRKPEAEIIHPPADFAAWEKERLVDRGLAE